MTTKKTLRTPSRLGANIRLFRKRNGLTQRGLEKLSGVHHIPIAMLETGARQNADIQTIEKLAKGLGVHISDLMAEQAVITPIEAILSSFLNSPWASILKPHANADEIEWLRGLPGIVWIGVTPTPEGLYHIIMARRTSTPLLPSKPQP